MQKHLDIIRQKTGNVNGRKALSKKQRVSVAVGILVIIVLVAAALVWRHANSSSAYIQTDKYQAIFLQNNQVYFGKLRQLTDDSYRLTDVFYVQQPSATAAANSTAQAGANPAQQPETTVQPTLVKLGEELHGPQDEVIVKDSQLLFWENLKSDGKVVKAIEEYKKKQ